jgi:homoserine dehydrogenase
MQALQEVQLVSESAHGHLQYAQSVAGAGPTVHRSHQLSSPSKVKNITGIVNNCAQCGQGRREEVIRQI